MDYCHTSFYRYLFKVLMVLLKLSFLCYLFRKCIYLLDCGTFGSPYWGGVNVSRGAADV